MTDTIGFWSAICIWIVGWTVRSVVKLVLEHKNQNLENERTHERYKELLKSE